MEENRTSLLEREAEYREKCPGCKMDRLKQEQAGVPYKLLSFIWIVSLCTGQYLISINVSKTKSCLMLLFRYKFSALQISSLFPFVYFMCYFVYGFFGWQIRDFHIAKREEDIGFYAGFVGSSFMVGRALTSLFWGVVADRYGRKPVILIGTFSVVVFNTLFGLSTNFWMALSMRFFLGCFNSLLGTIRAYASEVCREEYRALALSVVSTSRGIGLIIGPAIGGFFAQPVEKYPNLFAESSIFGRFPYFLPCLIISVYAVGSLVACKWLPETLHKHAEKANERADLHDISEHSSNDSGQKDNIVELEDKQIHKSNLLKNWPLVSTIIVYCVFSLQEMAYSEVSYIP
ncbi:hypothetical protein Goarm_008443 [Gossypium armourianum]|uniref:Major facilitator superfamily (MFS) profile domain-containing protein n=1 Tax=Gossypium armourianum TaxID=34283 RepID=A0A7J9JPU1_9ROSI|nr:hypothetical protein [Gossypium armourianum]